MQGGKGRRLFLHALGGFLSVFSLIAMTFYGLNPWIGFLIICVCMAAIGAVEFDSIGVVDFSNVTGDNDE